MRQLLYVLLLLFFPTLSLADINVKHDGNKTVYSETNNYSAPVVYIVELSAPTLLESRNAHSLQAMSEEHLKIKSILASRKNISIKHEYRFSINGFAVRTTRDQKPWLENIPGVERVSEEKRVYVSPLPDSSGENGMLLEDSVALIGATALHKNGIRGKGKLIAIIDTGIDKEHPAFSTPGKIVYSYNAINKSNDVTDGHGHGTHVAGIAAGNGGEIIGVAPEASLMVVKALTDSGYGSDVDIIDGMDHAADIDRDPATTDPVDVISMSLGTVEAGDPDDPMSRAVNTISEKTGAVFTIAAGNSGMVGISSPGVAERAITVGASTKYDTIAAFSSIGPVEKTFALKPDLVAPGVSINSSFPGGTYKVLSGTSMAAPHVAGAVALLLEQHPDWSPKDVKNSLMMTAKHLADVSAFSQGVGRVSLVEASSSDFALSPRYKYLGLFSSNSGTQKVTFELSYENISSKPETIKLSTAKSIDGISWNYPDNVTVPPHGTVKIPFSVDINNDLLSFPNEARMAHEPHIVFERNNNKYIFPVYLIRGIPVTIFANPGSGVFLINLDSRVNRNIYPFAGDRMTTMLPGGKYWGTSSILNTAGTDFYHVGEVFDINKDNNSIDLSIQKSIYTLRIDHRDLDGQPCKKSNAWVGLLRDFSSEGWNVSFSSANGLTRNTKQIHVNDSGVTLSLSSKCAMERDYSILARPPMKVTGNEVISTPEKMIPVYVDVNPIYESSKFWISDSHCHFYGCVGDFSFPSTLTKVKTIWFDGNPMNLSWYIVKDKKIWRTAAQFYVDKNSVAHFGGHNNYYRAVPMKTFSFGYPTITWQGVFENRNNAITIRNTDKLMNPFLFLDSSWIKLEDIYNYKLESGGSVVSEGELAYVVDRGTLKYFVDTNPGKQKLTVYSPNVDTQDGEASLVVQADFDSGAADPNPPVVRNIEVVDNEGPSYEFNLEQPVNIFFEAFDREGSVQLTEAFLRHEVVGKWIPVSIGRVAGNDFTGSIRLDDDGLYDLKMRVVDTSGNSMEITQIAGIRVIK